MPTVTLVREGRTLEVAAGADLRGALMGAGVEVYRAPDDLLNCRGNGLCGTCIVEVEPREALSAPTFREAKGQLWKYGDRPIRLSCQAKVVADCRILTQPQVAQGWMAHPFYAHLKEGVSAGPAKEKGDYRQ